MRWPRWLTRKREGLASRGADAKIDHLEMGLLSSPLQAVDLPLTHRFTRGLYAREIFMPAGTLLTSKVHKTEHPYVILTGRVSVFIIDDNGGERVEHLAAPHVGVTQPGTRRVLYIHEDCRWVTFHPLKRGERDESDLGRIEGRIIEPRELPDGTRTFERYVEKMRRGELVGEVA